MKSEEGEKDSGGVREEERLVEENLVDLVVGGKIVGDELEAENAATAFSFLLFSLFDFGLERVKKSSEEG